MRQCRTSGQHGHHRPSSPRTVTTGATSRSAPSPSGSGRTSPSLASPSRSTSGCPRLKGWSVRTPAGTWRLHSWRRHGSSRRPQPDQHHHATTLAQEKASVVVGLSRLGPTPGPLLGAKVPSVVREAVWNDGCSVPPLPSSPPESRVERGRATTRHRNAPHAASRGGSRPSPPLSRRGTGP